MLFLRGFIFAGRVKNRPRSRRHDQIKAFVAGDTMGRGKVASQPAIGQIRLPDKGAAHGDSINFFQCLHDVDGIPPLRHRDDRTIDPSLDLQGIFQQRPLLEGCRQDMIPPTPPF